MNTNKKPWFKSDGFAYVAVWVIVPTVGILAFNWDELTATFVAIVITVLVGLFSKD